MPVEFNYVRGPVALVRRALLDTLDQYASDRRALTIGITANPLLSFIDHSGEAGADRGQYLGERLVCIYQTRSLDEAVSARDLLLAHARATLPALSVRPGERGGLPEPDPDLPFFVYLLGDTVRVFPRERIPQR